MVSSTCLKLSSLIQLRAQSMTSYQDELTSCPKKKKWIKSEQAKVERFQIAQPPVVYFLFGCYELKNF